MLLRIWETLPLSGGHIVGMQDSTLASQESLRPSQSVDVRLAASTMPGATRRALQAEMALPYGRGHPLLAAPLFGWGRHTVEVGLAERRTGSMGRGAPSTCRGRTPWEDTQPEAAEALGRLAEAHAPQDPTCRPTLASTRLTAQAALEALSAQEDSEDQCPAPSTLAAGLQRMGFRRRTVGKATPHKKIAETDAIVAHIEQKSTQRSPRTTAPACAAMVQPRGASVRWHGAAGRGAITTRVTTTWVGTSRTSPAGWGRQMVVNALARLAAPTRPALASSMRLRRGGQHGMRPHQWPWHGCR
jgi:hypothetical protein